MAKQSDEVPDRPTADSLPPIDAENPDLDAIMAHLETDTGVYPEAAVRAAIANREAITPRLLAILDEEPEVIVEHERYWGHSFALVLLGLFREQRAYPRLLDLLSRDEQTVDELFGDELMEGVSRVLASVSGGDMEAMKRLVEDPDGFEFARTSVVNAMVCLVAGGLQSRESVMDYFRELFDEKLEREPSFVWTALVNDATDLYPQEVAEQIALAYEDDLVDETFVHPAHILERLDTGSVEDVPKTLAERGYRLVDDVGREMRDWSWFE